MLEFIHLFWPAGTGHRTELPLRSRHALFAEQKTGSLAPKQGIGAREVGIDLPAGLGPVGHRDRPAAGYGDENCLALGVAGFLLGLRRADAFQCARGPKVTPA